MDAPLSLHCYQGSSNVTLGERYGYESVDFNSCLLMAQYSRERKGFRYTASRNIFVCNTRDYPRHLIQ